MGRSEQTQYIQTPLEDVLDFCVALSREMIVSGANLERVQLALERVCHVYRLHDLAVNLMSTFISISARDEQGHYATRQAPHPRRPVLLYHCGTLSEGPGHV